MRTLYKTSEFVAFIKSSNMNVTLVKNPDISTIERIKKIISKNKELFDFHKSLFK